MSIVKIPDAGGDMITMLEVDGNLFPTYFGRNLFKQTKTNSMRPDDIVICAYPKCGTHWVWEIVRCIQANTTDVPVSEKETCMIEFHSNSDLEKFPSPRILNSHLLYEQLPDEFMKKKCKIIYLYRNLKDVTVSYYHHHVNGYDYHYGGEWKNFLPLMLDGKVGYGSCFEYVRDWEEVMANTSHPILVLFYEDIKENPQREVSKIAKFLDKDCSDDFIQEVCDKCDFDVMKRKKGHLIPGTKAEAQMYRKGQVGDWKNHFTVAENEMFDRLYAEKMAGSKLQFRYEL